MVHRSSIRLTMLLAAAGVVACSVDAPPPGTEVPLGPAGVPDASLAGSGGSLASSSSSSRSVGVGGTGGFGTTSSSSSVGVGGTGGFGTTSSSSSVGVGGTGGFGTTSSSSSAGVGGTGGFGTTSSSSSAGTGGTGGGPVLGMDGTTCSVDGECQSGHCVDGVCCESACGGLCQACRNAYTGAPDGTCANAKVDTDPYDQCPQETPNLPCGGLGVCDGAGQCKKVPASTVCGTLSCSGDTQTNPPACDGLGNCKPTTTVSCNGKGCDPSMTVCNNPCVDDADCGAMSYCKNGVCFPQGGPGVPCAKTTECLGGNCVDNVCCDKACGAFCEACTVAKGAPVDGACFGLTGTTCDDGVACTAAACLGGVCAGTPLCALDVCEEKVSCDEDAGVCVKRSKLDGAPCTLGGKAGICIAGSCLVAAGAGSGSGSSGAAGASASGGMSSGGGAPASGSGGSGSSGGPSFRFLGGGCSVGERGDTRAAWLFAGLVAALGVRARRARRGDRNA